MLSSAHRVASSHSPRSKPYATPFARMNVPYVRVTPTSSATITPSRTVSIAPRMSPQYRFASPMLT